MILLRNHFLHNLSKTMFTSKGDRLLMTKNVHVLNWINEMAEMTQPDRIVWIDGSEEQTEALRKEAVSTGELIKLNPELYPNCYLHRTAVNDVARVENRTFICTKRKRMREISTIGWPPPSAMKSSESFLKAL